MKRWTKEDLEPQQCVCAVIINKKKPQQVLIQKHNKLRKWTIPVGKLAASGNYEDAVKALHKELEEECGIQVFGQVLLTKTIFKGSRNGKIMDIPMYLFLITAYAGRIKNCEQHKHETQKFMDPYDLVQDNQPISHALRMWLKYVKRKNALVGKIG